MKKLRVVFMGTPEFAVATLDTIRKSGHEVVCVVTTPDKPAGRGRQTRFSDVKNYALQHGLPLKQPEKLKDDALVEDLRDYLADVFVVVAFRMLPKCIYQIPPMGTFNVHASLLPQYRGAAPIQRAIMNGETMTGVTTFLLDEHTDTGLILNQTPVPILPGDNAGTLHDKLMVAGAELAVKTLDQLAAGQAKPTPQPIVPDLKPAPKLFKDDMHIVWDNPAAKILDQIRGLSPYPAAFSLLKPKGSDEKPLVLKIFDAIVSDVESVDKPGRMKLQSTKKMAISTQDFDIFINSLQIEGKKRMKIEEFLKGFHFENYTFFLE